MKGFSCEGLTRDTVCSFSAAFGRTCFGALFRNSSTKLYTTCHCLSLTIYLSLPVIAGKESHICWNIAEVVVAVGTVKGGR